MYKMREGEDGVLYRIAMLLFSFGIGLFSKMVINTKIIMKVTMTDEGTLTIDGEFKVDAESMKFSYEDLEIVNAE